MVRTFSAVAIVLACLVTPIATPVEADTLTKSNVNKVNASARKLTKITLTTTKTASGALAKITEELEAAKKINKWPEYTKYLGKLKKLGQIAEGLGMVGSVANFLLTMNDPSDTDRIIGEIKQVDKHLTEMTNHLDRQFKDLKQWQLLHTAKQETTEPLTKIASATRQWSLYQSDVRNGNADGHQFNGWTLKDLETPAQAIMDQCSGSNNRVAIFEAILDESHGDVRPLLEMGQLLLMRLADAQRAYSSLYALQLAAKGDSSNAIVKAAQASAKDFKDYRDTCMEELEKAFRSLTKRDVLAAYIKADMEEAHKTFQGWNNALVALDINKYLQGKHPQLDFVTAVYQPVAGFENHTVTWRHNLPVFTKFREAGSDGLKRNLIVLWDFASEKFNALPKSCREGLESVRRVKPLVKGGGLASASQIPLGYTQDGAEKRLSAFYKFIKMGAVSKEICGGLAGSNAIWVGRRGEVQPLIIAASNPASLYKSDNQFFSQFAFLDGSRLPLSFSIEDTSGHQVVLKSDPSACIGKSGDKVVMATCSTSAKATDAGATDRRFSFTDDIFLRSDADPTKCIAIEGDVPDVGRDLVLGKCEDGPKTAAWRHVAKLGLFISARKRNVCIGRDTKSGNLATMTCGFDNADKISWAVLDVF